MSLYLKYRPRNLADLVGQDHIKTTLMNAIRLGTLSHAYLFAGPRGTGKTSTARLVAKALTCQNEAMGEMADAGNLVDIIEIDAASNRGIDEIRDLREKIQFAPVIAKAKVYIIDEVHMLTKEAFNALLKTLEEPPSHAYFILATTELHKVPETILSRCQHFSFQRISEDGIVGYLEHICKSEELTCERQALEVIADNANGGMRDAISTLEQMIVGRAVTFDYVRDNLGLVSSKVVASFAEELIAGHTQNTLETVAQLVHEGFDLSQFLRELVEYLREAMLKSVSQGQSPERILEVIEVMQEAAQKVKNSLIPQLPLEVACIKLGDISETVSTPEKSSGGIFSAMGFGGGEKKEVKKEETLIEKSADLVKEEKKPEEKPIESVALAFSQTNVQTRWKEIIDKVPTQTVKVAARNVEITVPEDGILELSTPTDFYFDTLTSAQGRMEIAQVLESFFHQKIQVQCKKGEKIQLTTNAQESAQKQENQGPSIADIAGEIFNS